MGLFAVIDRSVERDVGFTLGLAAERTVASAHGVPTLPTPLALVRCMYIMRPLALWALTVNRLVCWSTNNTTIWISTGQCQVLSITWQCLFVIAFNMDLHAVREDYKSVSLFHMSYIMCASNCVWLGVCGSQWDIISFLENLTDRAPPYWTSRHKEKKDRKTTERRVSTIKFKYFHDRKPQWNYLLVYVSKHPTVQGWWDGSSSCGISAFTETPEHNYPALTSYLHTVFQSLNVREEIHFHSQILIDSSKSILTQTNKQWQGECKHNKEILHVVIEDKQCVWRQACCLILQNVNGKVTNSQVEWVRDNCDGLFLAAFYWGLVSAQSRVFLL